MTTSRNERDAKAASTENPSAAELQRTGGPSPEDDPRRHDGQDVRTAGRATDRAKDDPSRAPESGTP